MPITDEDADLESTIGTAARVARKTHDDVHHAMLTSALPYHRGHDGRRVVNEGMSTTFLPFDCPR